ncbi:hypothetical protein SNEBB_004985 [Seison nebaliae]|nr:hypothetical protein SNEBB_004985 [Seison nebaliae]
MDKEDESISALVDNFLNSEIEKKTNELSLLQTWIQNVRNRMNVLRNDIGLPQNYQIPTEYFSSGRRPKDNELMSMIQNDSNKTNLTFTVGDTSRFCGPKLPRVHSDLFNSVYLHEECRLNCLSSVKNEVTHYWTFYIQNGNHTFNAMNYIDYVIVKYPFNNHLKQIKMTGPHFRIGDKSSSNVPLDITIYFKSSIRKASDTNTNCVYYKFQHYVELNSSITKKEVVGSNKRHIIPVKIEDNDDVDDDDDTIKSEYHPYDTATSDYDMPSGNELDRHCEKCDLFGDFYSDGNDIDFPNVTVSSESEDVQY